MSLETICCGCNVFTMAKITTGIEIGLHIIYGFYVPIRVPYISVSICLAYLAIEFIGINKKTQGLILLNGIIRVIVSILNGFLIIIALLFVWETGFGKKHDTGHFKIAIGFLIFFVATMIYLIFRTWLQFKVFYANRVDNTTFSLQTICWGCNVFTMAKIITGIEIGFHIILMFYCTLLRVV